MKNATPLALALSLPLAAAAQDIDFQDMQAGLSMLELNVDRILDRNGFDDVDPTSLSLNAIVEIINVAEDDDRSGTTWAGIQGSVQNHGVKSRI